MANLIPISAVVGDRSYRIKIQPNDEEVVRKTLKMINDKIVEFRTLFAGKDMQDYMAMVLLAYVTEASNPPPPALDDREITLSLVRLENQLDRALEDSSIV